jgi:uncharacterized delta-60 repeat protein
MTFRCPLHVATIGLVTPRLCLLTGRPIVVRRGGAKHVMRHVVSMLAFFCAFECLGLASSGIVRTDLSGQTDRGFALAQQPWDDRLVIAGLADYGGHLGDFGLVRYLSDGRLDMSFGRNGIVLTDFAGGTDVANAVVATVGPKGEQAIIAAGFASAGCDFCGVGALARYSASGKLDRTFGVKGKVTTSFLAGDNEQQFSALAVDSANRIVAVGSSGTFAADSHDFVIARYDWSGSLDQSFGIAGIVRLNIEQSPSNDYATSVAVQSDDKIIVGGYTYTGVIGNDDMVFIRLNTDGTLDTTFGSPTRALPGFGRVIINLGGGERTYAVQLQPDGKIVGAGFYVEPTTHIASIAFARLDSNGILDYSFGAAGTSVPHFQTGVSERATALALQSDGQLVASGYADFKFIVVRMNGDGFGDTSFGSGAYTIVPVGGSTAQSLSYGVVVQDDGKIVAAGYVADNAGQDFAAVRLTSTGEFDGSFDP